MSCAISINDVVFRYLKNGKRNILNHTTFSIEEGTLTLIMGSSGSGKSTLAAVLAGLYPENGGYLESGEVRLFGHLLSEMNSQERAKYLTILFQNPSLQFCMDNLREEMRFCMENICVPADEMDNRLDEASVKLGVIELLDRPFHTLSGGEQQRAALACLYVLNSQCIILDESFANLDEQSQKELKRLILQLLNEKRTILVIDHKADLWVDVADEIILLSAGANIYKRGINSLNIDKYRDAFEKLGLFYPNEAYVMKECRSGKDEGEKDTILSFRNLSIRAGLPQKRRWKKSVYDTPYLLEKAQADFPKGALTAILGRSGSGKSTTFMSILKQHPYEGEIKLQGSELSDLSENELFKQVGIVFQNPANQFVTQSVEEEIITSFRIWKNVQGEEMMKEQAEFTLERYGLKSLHRYSPYMLSQGQQRRLAVLAVLAGGQQVLLLDEPTYGQDEKSVNAIMEHLDEKVKAEGLCVIFITHDRELARAWADKIYVLKNKKMIETNKEDI